MENKELNTFFKYECALTEIVKNHNLGDVPLTTIIRFITTNKLDKKFNISVDDVKHDIENVRKKLLKEQDFEIYLQLLKNELLPLVDEGLSSAEIMSFLQKHGFDKHLSITCEDVRKKLAEQCGGGTWKYKSTPKSTFYNIHIDYRRALKQAIYEHTYLSNGQIDKSMLYKIPLTDVQIKIFLKKNGFDVKYGITLEDVKNDMFDETESLKKMVIVRKQDLQLSLFDLVEKELCEGQKEHTIPKKTNTQSVKLLPQEDFALVQKLANSFMLYPEVLDDKRKFKGLLFDLIPTNRIEVNILMQIYELGFVQKTTSTSRIDEKIAYRISKQVCSEYGTDKKLADRMALIWTECFKIIKDFKDKAKSKEIEITFLVETSKAMYDERICAVNHAIQSSIVDLKYIFREHKRLCDVNFFTFSEDVENEYVSGNSIEDLIFNELSASNSEKCNLGKAIKRLTDDINTFRYAEANIESFIIFIITSSPTDDYTDALKKANETAYFRNAHKFLCVIGNEIDKSILSGFNISKTTFIESKLGSIAKPIEKLILEK